MTFTLENLTDYLEGKWISNQTIYNLKNKKTYNNKFITEIPSLTSLNDINLNNIICITKTHNQYTIYQYSLPNLLNKKQGFINKTKNKRIKKYIYVFNSTKILKVTNFIKNIKYTEYIYFIDINFKLSFSIMKIYDKYNAICFTSDIKLSINKTNSIDSASY
uniref:hypothetical protein n=1 Tax=Hypnea musciformis TaxID=31429 RepID=UPI0027DA6449|nr:hypothetical protein REP96_pgp121 [Hypnea musciformis]WCH56905.1 hypothetical protein [Hypnea musciformis]